MVEWIEIAMTYYVAVLEAVSTLVVEWIEIPIAMNPPRLLIVSTLVVEWIEIDERMYINQWFSRLHPRGGVD